MRKNILLVLFFILAFCSPTAASAASSTMLIISPVHITQGEPAMISISGLGKSVTVKKIVFDGTPLGVFTYRAVPTALVGIDLNKKPGAYKVSATLSNGKVLAGELVVNMRPKIEAPLGIPAKLGGNTPESQTKLITSLDAENKSLINLKTGVKAFWTSAFGRPLKETFVTDEYGYLRQTGEYSIPHKGTDFRAKEGTSVMAINGGIVRVAKVYRNYGNTVVVDHGMGLMSFYMHLSKIKVNVGELVKPGQVVGLSGQTGYAESPHLHLTIRIHDISIDPMKFFDLFK